MRQLNESFSDIKPITSFLSEQMYNENLDEGLRDWAKNAFTYLKNTFTKIGNVIWSTIDGFINPAITPLTTQSMYMSHMIPNDKIIPLGSKGDKKFSKINTSEKTVLDSYPSTLQSLRETKSRRKKLHESLINEDVELTHANPNVRNVNKDRLMKFIKASLKPSAKPLLIWGAPGVGKTAIVKMVMDVCYKKEQNARLIVVPLATLRNDDFSLPSYVVNDEGDKIGATDVPKTWMPVYKKTGDPDKDAELDAACGEGILFFDEMSRATPGVMNVCLKLIDERLLGSEFYVGSGWKMISASNRLEDDPNTNNDLSTALGNRFVQVNYSPRFEDWRKWANKHQYMNNDVLDFIELNQKYFYLLTTDENGSLNTVYPSPRSWEIACIEMCNFVDTGLDEGFDVLDLDEEDILDVIGAAVGVDTAKKFMEYVSIKKTIDLEKLRLVWSNPAKAPLPKEKRSDLMYIIISSIMSLQKDEPTPEEFTNLIKYLIRLKDESMASKAVALATRMWPKLNGKMSDGTGELNDAITLLATAYPKLAEDYDEFVPIHLN